MRVWAASVGVCLCMVAGCEDDAPAKPPISKVAPVERPASAPKHEVLPPEVRLTVLQERLAVGLSIQNRSGHPQQFSSSLGLVGGEKGRELSLSEGTQCITLRPGGEWLWPSDWGQTLAPDQSAISGLVGTFRFEARACEGGAVVQSAPFALPARYGEEASAPGR